MTHNPEELRLRLALETDLPALRLLMDAAIRELQASFLSPEQLAASFSIMGLDTQLIADRTYFVVEATAGQIAGCGGWSRRATLFGGDHSQGRDAALLDPAKDAARVRAMYTHPDFTRRGVGRRVLDACEAAAAAEGFRRCELAATLAGEPLYRACGYRQIERFHADTPGRIGVPLVRMSKALRGREGRTGEG
jgi:GNAT superfamily N-acetyltransferase